MAPYCRIRRPLRFTRPGRLLPWLGPALRGLLARPFKESVCLHPPGEREQRWVYCRGCPHMAACPYGQTLEPDPPPGAEVFSGQEEAARPVVLALPFPMPPFVRPGDETTVSLTFVGEAAIGHAERVGQALLDAGERFGFDPERTTFTASGNAQVEGPLPIELPLQAGPPDDVIPRLRVTLTAPLFLRHRDAQGRRRTVLEPTFADLLRASLRTLGGLSSLYGRPIPADFAALKEASFRVPLIRSNYAGFHQDHRSNRSGSRALHGVMGNGVYGPVPRSLAAWLEWGGRVHVGEYRVAGAGGWQVEPA